VSDAHMVASHPVPALRASVLPATPIPVPQTVSFIEPVLNKLAWKGWLTDTMSKEAEWDTLPVFRYSVKTICLLDLKPIGCLQRIDVCDFHDDPEHEVWPILTTNVGAMSILAPKTVTLLDPDFAWFKATIDEIRPWSLEKRRVKLPTFAPEVRTALQLLEITVDIWHCK
jgi:hypothetical protein